MKTSAPTQGDKRDGMNTDVQARRAAMTPRAPADLSRLHPIFESILSGIEQQPLILHRAAVKAAPRRFLSEPHEPSAFGGLSEERMAELMAEEWADQRADELRDELGEET